MWRNSDIQWAQGCTIHSSLFFVAESPLEYVLILRLPICEMSAAADMHTDCLVLVWTCLQKRTRATSANVIPKHSNNRFTNSQENNYCESHILHSLQSEFAPDSQTSQTYSACFRDMLTTPVMRSAFMCFCRCYFCLAFRSQRLVVCCFSPPERRGCSIVLI